MRVGTTGRAHRAHRERRTLPFALSVVGATEGSEPRGTLRGFRCSRAPSGSSRGNRLGSEGGEQERRGRRSAWTREGTRARGLSEQMLEEEPQEQLRGWGEESFLSTSEDSGCSLLRCWKMRGWS